MVDMSYLIDTHCHLHDKEFFTPEQAEEMLKRAHKKGIKKIICIGTSHEDSLVARDFASVHKDVYWTYGIHPENTVKHLEYDFSGDGSLTPVVTGFAPLILGRDLRTPPKSVFQMPATNTQNIRVENSNQSHTSEKADFKPPVAIGEVGLDYHYEGYNREAQIRLFEEMLQLASDNNLPVSFHVREAYDDFFPILANFPKIRGVVHSFTDSKKVLKRILNETKFFVGVNGLATYSTLPVPPLERILLETDAPFLAPVPHRGSKNEPAFVTEVAKWLSDRLNTPLGEIAEITTQNCENLFNFL